MQPVPNGAEAPSRKRPRVDNSADEDGGRGAETIQGARKRDEEFWYEDGTVILVARDVEFRIYKGLLADHSPVFRDMFSLPQPLEPPEAESAPCPVVHLADSPEDLRYVLRIYMARGDPSPFTPDDPSFDLISACIRLAHKYQMSKLLEHSVAYLKNWYPTNLETWQKHYSTAGAHYIPIPLGFEHIHAIGVVNLARLTGESSILPAAFLDCCTLEEQVLDGFDRPDGTHEELPLADLRRCLTARTQLSAAGVAIFAHAYREEVSEECKTPELCRMAFRKALAVLYDRAVFLTDADPFEPLSRLDDKHGVSLCSCCFDGAMKRGREEQQASWDALAEIFKVEVDGWGASRS